MISSEVQRTLVKSPPELWAELSDPTSLARHLGELGEIRITRSEPEKRVEWEAEGARGSVLIKPSGWGTKVTLSVTREVSLPEPALESEAAAEPTPEVSADPEPEESVLETAREPDPEVAAEPVQVAVLEADEIPAATPEETLTEAVAAETPEERALEAEAIEPGTEPRRGFFARLFGRRKPKVTQTPELASETTLAALPTLTPDQVSPPLASCSPGSAIESLQARFQAQPAVEAAAAAEGEPPAVERDPHETEGIVDPPEAETAAEEAPVEEISEPQIDLAAELEAAEEVAVEEVTALLTGVLDRLGAAHHRPFSRS